MIKRRVLYPFQYSFKATFSRSTACASEKIFYLILARIFRRNKHQNILRRAVGEDTPGVPGVQEPCNQRLLLLPKLLLGDHADAVGDGGPVRRRKIPAADQCSVIGFRYLCPTESRRETEMTFRLARAARSSPSESGSRRLMPQAWKRIFVFVQANRLTIM